MKYSKSWLYTALTIAGIGALVGIFIPGCTSIDKKSDKATQDKQEILLKEGNRKAGLPNIVNFSEKKAVKLLLELRDKPNITYTYSTDMYGKVHFICTSVMYSVPYALQYTNPAKIEHPYTSTPVVLPQADPNGLFAPTSAEASWAMCSDGKGGILPVYSEDRLRVSPVKLKEYGELDLSTTASFSIPESALK